MLLRYHYQLVPAARDSGRGTGRRASVGFEGDELAPEEP